MYAIGVAARSIMDAEEHQARDVRVLMSSSLAEVARATLPHLGRASFFEITRLRPAQTSAKDGAVHGGGHRIS